MKSVVVDKVASVAQHSELGLTHWRGPHHFALFEGELDLLGLSADFEETGLSLLSDQLEDFGDAKVL